MACWTSNSGLSIFGMPKCCSCLWGCLNSLVILLPSFIHSANVHWGPVLCLKTCWKLQEFAVAEEPHQHRARGRECWWRAKWNGSPLQCRDPMDSGQVAEACDLLEHVCSLWKPKVPFYVSTDIMLLDALVQAELPLFRSWKSKSLHMRTWSSVCLEVDVGIFLLGEGGIVIPLN